MLQLADFIETLPDHKFDMSYWISEKEQNNYSDEWIVRFYPRIWEPDTDQVIFEPFDCGTACCIAGWAAMMKNDFKPMPFFVDDETIESRAREWLDLTHEQSNNLFLVGISSVWSSYIATMDFDFDQYEENYVNIKNRHASEIIRDIVNGVVDIDIEYDYHFYKSHLEDLGYYDEGEWDD